MIRSILFGKSIYKILSSSPDVKNFVGDKIYPLVAKNTTTFPFIVFSRDSLSSEYCKDGLYEEGVSFTVTVVHSEYLKICEIAQAVRETFQKRYLDDTDLNISDCEMTSIDESFEEDSFVQRLTFKATLRNKR